MDLIDRLAVAEGVKGLNTDEAKEKWYNEKYGAPNYSDIIEKLGKTESERSIILSEFFEPTDEEKRVGRKSPTLAHNAIAELVKAGFIRVIITTNFDQLMERALEKEEVYPDIISTPDMIKGKMPIQHQKEGCLIVKLHGDYKDVCVPRTASSITTRPLA